MLCVTLEDTPRPRSYISEHPQFRDKYTRPACYFLKQFNFIQKIVYEFVIIRNIWVSFNL